jgi:hypothetical protein
LFVGQCCEAENVCIRGLIARLSRAAMSRLSELEAAFCRRRRFREMFVDEIRGEEGKTLQES